MHKIVLFTFISFLIISCKSKEERIIQEVIESHGGNAYDTIGVKFNFRNLTYQLKRKTGAYEYQRIQLDSLGNEIKDILTNDSFVRYLNKVEVPVEDSMVIKYQNSINSVAYFFMLPNGLQDPTVNKLYEKDVKIKGKDYHQLKVWFNQEGGGVDYQDIYLFWINADTKKLDYLAYSYETDGGGVRFRESINGKKVGPFYFQNYNNYGYDEQEHPLSGLPKEFENGILPFLSKIENEDITLKK
jgi:hypothetical protein